MQELDELSQRFAFLRFAVQHEGAAFVSGTFNVAPDVGYTTTLEVPSTYPADVPVLHCDPAEIPWELDRHVIEQNGHACLCARSEYGLHWPEGSTLSDFIERLVQPFFMGQFYYETHGCWPSTGARSHGWRGIIEAYEELCAPLGNASTETIIRLMRLLSRRNDPQGHEICPCGSGQTLRCCHRTETADLRMKVRPNDAALDLEHVLHFTARGRDA